MRSGKEKLTHYESRKGHWRIRGDHGAGRGLSLPDILDIVLRIFKEMDHTHILYVRSIEQVTDRGGKTIMRILCEPARNG